MRLVLALILIASAPAFAFNNKVFLTVSLSKNSATLTKITPRGKRMEIHGWILPVRAESMRLQQPFRPLQMRDRFQSKSGNVILTDVVLFDNNKTLRTSRMFKKCGHQGARFPVLS